MHQSNKLRCRLHRGLLEESLATTFEFSTLEQLAENLNCKPRELKFSYYGYDDRCDWDVWLVFENEFPIAMIDRLIPTEANASQP
jgi:hypothetical protein